MCSSPNGPFRKDGFSNKRKYLSKAYKVSKHQIICRWCCYTKFQNERISWKWLDLDFNSDTTSSDNSQKCWGRKIQLMVRIAKAFPISTTIEHTAPLLTGVEDPHWFSSKDI